MALPKKLKYFNLFVNWISFVGQIESFTPQKFTRKIENFCGGMPGSAPIDLGYDDNALIVE